MELFYIVFILSCTMVNVLGDFTNNEIPDFDREMQIPENSVEIDQQVNVVEPAPCQMVSSPYGCCWDNKSLPTGPNGKGCPVCKDRKSRHCKNWAKQCYDQTVRSICPRTCGLCKSQHSFKDKNCKDNHKWKTQCKLYKYVNVCYIPSIEKNCRESCGKCYV